MIVALGPRLEVDVRHALVAEPYEKNRDCNKLDENGGVEEMNESGAFRFS